MCPAAKCPRGGGSRSGNRSATGSDTAASDRTTAAATKTPPHTSASEGEKWMNGFQREKFNYICNLRDLIRRGRLD